jgi:3D (Asp-Asp-Asp) domain-containing protein
MKNSREFHKILTISALMLVAALGSPAHSKGRSLSKSSSTISESASESTFKARITFYYPNEARSGFKSAKGDRLVPWKSAAVCFRTIPYGSKIKVPGIGTLIAQDTGSAVISRKAARGQGQNVPVIDVCVANRADMVRMQKDFPMFVEVEVAPKARS